MLTGDPCDPINQVRLIIGDTSQTLVSDEVIQGCLDETTQQVKPASLKLLDYILADLSTQITHSVGEVYIDTKKLYEQVRNLRDRLVRDPSFMGGLPIIVGGTSKAEVDRVNTHSDFYGSPIQRGFGTGD